MVFATIETPQLLLDTVVNAHKKQVVQVFIPARSSSFAAMACAWPVWWLRCTPRCVPLLVGLLSPTTVAVHGFFW